MPRPYSLMMLHPSPQVCIYLGILRFASVSQLSVPTSILASQTRRAGSLSVGSARPVVSSVSRHPLPKKSAWPRRCRRGSTWPARAAAPGPPGSQPSLAPGKGSWEPRGGCRRRWRRGEARPATGRVPDSTGGRSGWGRRRQQEAHLHREMGRLLVVMYV